MNDINTRTAGTAIATALLVSNDTATIAEIGDAMQQLAISQEVCSEAPAVLVLLNRRKFDAVVVDLALHSRVNTILERVRRSPSNRTAVLFAISDSDDVTVSAFKAGSNFVLTRPLSISSISKTLKVAFGLILRERRRYFRCPVKIPATICRAGLPNVEGETLNISENGMAIATSTPLRAGLQVEVRFRIPGHASEFVVPAVICWCKHNYLGLQFTTISSDTSSRLQEWLLQQLENSLPAPLAERFRNVTHSSSSQDVR